MLFNSLDFAVFLPIVFLLYWFVFNKTKTQQNLLVVVSSYLFYSWWDWRFLFLIFFSTIVDYLVGLALSKEKKEKKRKNLLLISIFVNIGFLGFFKYFNFFLDSFIESFSFFGVEFQGSPLNIILPVGISFYTFQSLSYTIDVYRNKLEPTKDFISFTAFVSFFPQLVAGPIERATNLLPQFYKKRHFDYDKAVGGVHLIIWGLFKKIVIADSCAAYVNEIFSNYETMNSISLLLGGIYFSFQMYGDFSGYSDIAIGTSRLFGIDLKKNFNYPFFSQNIAEFWRKWHISLTSWLTEYVFTPLSIYFRDYGKLGLSIAIVINFTICGVWHGANWTYIVFGFLHGLLFIPLIIRNSSFKEYNISEQKKIPSLKEILNITITFTLVMLSLIIFRANNITEAVNYLKILFSFNFDGGFQLLLIRRYTPELIILIFSFVGLEWYSREKEHPFFGRWNNLKLITILMCLLLFGAFANSTEFIYFQF